jgi:hypothetical protein
MQGATAMQQWARRQARAAGVCIVLAQLHVLFCSVQRCDAWLPPFCGLIGAAWARVVLIVSQKLGRPLQPLRLQPHAGQHKPPLPGRHEAGGMRHVVPRARRCCLPGPAHAPSSLQLQAAGVGQGLVQRLAAVLCSPPLLSVARVDGRAALSIATWMHFKLLSCVVRPTPCGRPPHW